MPPSKARPARRKSGAKDSPGVQIEYEGRTYVVRQSDLTPRDIVALRKETGFAGWLGLLNAAQQGFDLDVLAAFLWLARRHEGEFVPYELVLDDMRYDAALDVKSEGEGGDSAEDDSPEA